MIAGTNIEKIIFQQKLSDVTEQLRKIEESVRTGVKTTHSPFKQRRGKPFIIGGVKDELV